jgi:hypothetical protein
MALKLLSLKHLPAAGAAFALMAIANPAKAVQPVTFTTTSVNPENNSSKIFSSDPSAVTFSVSNPNPAFNSVGGVNTTSSGLCAWAQVGTQAGSGRCGFDVDNGFSGQTLNLLQGVFDKSVILKSFSIGQVAAGTSGGQITFLNGPLQETFNISGTGSYDFSSSFEIAAGDSLSILTKGTTSSANGGLFRINSLNVEDVPGPLPFLGAAAAFGWSRKLRQKTKLSD